MGAAKYAVRVQLDPDKLHAEKIGINEVDQAITNWNVNLPTGQLFGPIATYNIKAGGQLMNADAFKPVVVTYRRGAPVRLDQVANVDRQRRERLQRQLVLHQGSGRQAARIQRSIMLQVMRQPGTNTIAVDRRGPHAAADVRGATAAVGAPDAAAGSLAHDSQGVHRHPGDDARDAPARGRRHLSSSCTTDRRR